MTLDEVCKLLNNLGPDEKWARAAELPSDMLLAWLDHVFSPDELARENIKRALREGKPEVAKQIAECCD